MKLSDLFVTFRRNGPGSRRMPASDAGPEEAVGEGVQRFVSGELLSGVAGWSAGLSGSWLVSQFFVARGLRNVWGLAASGDRTVVSTRTYEWLGTISEYLVGLLVLLVVQHFVAGVARKYVALRSAGGAAGREGTTKQV